MAASQSNIEKLNDFIGDYLKTECAQSPNLQKLKNLCEGVSVDERSSLINRLTRHSIGIRGTNEYANCLHFAAKQGHTGMITTLLDNLPEDVKVKLLITNIVKMDGHSLSVVALTAHQGSVGWLIREVDLFSIEENKFSILAKALSHACRCRNIATVKAIVGQLNTNKRVEALMSSSSTLTSGNIATHIAAVHSRNADVMTCILSDLTLDDVADLLLFRNKKGQTALHCALENNNQTMVNVITNSFPQADLADLLQVKDNLGETVVHYAGAISSRRGPINALRINQISAAQQMALLKIENNRKQTVFDVARQHSNNWALKYFEDHYNQASDPRTLHGKYND